jgi:hypothetical protein
MDNTFYYKRNFKQSEKLLKKGISTGETLTFFGNLYSDKDYTKEVATSEIKYKILHISSKGVLIKTTNKYKFNQEGSITFEGIILAKDFKMENGIIKSYYVEKSCLGLIKGTKNYKYSYGNCEYMINNNGIGKVKVMIKILSEI